MAPSKAVGQETNPPVTEFSELEWIKLREEVSQPAKGPGFLSKMKSKASENPFIPIGLVATSCCLGYGLYTMVSGETRKSQIMMRARVVAQGLTVVAMIVGMGMAARKKQ